MNIVVQIYLKIKKKYIYSIHPSVKVEVEGYDSGNEILPEMSSLPEVNRPENNYASAPDSCSGLKQESDTMPKEIQTPENSSLLMHKSAVPENAFKFNLQETGIPEFQSSPLQQFRAPENISPIRQNFTPDNSSIPGIPENTENRPIVQKTGPSEAEENSLYAT